MIYLTQMLGKPVLDAAGEEIGSISDVAIATGEVFPRVTSLAFTGPDKTPFMLSWRKYVADFDGERIALNVAAPDIRFSYLQPDEVLLARDLLNKQIVDTQGKKVVRVNDLKLSESRNQLRLLGAEVGVRGLLRSISPGLERGVRRVARSVRLPLPENLIAWNYMDLLDRDLSQVKLSVTHRRLHELHPADVADILEKLAPTQRATVFEHLDNAQAAEAISELEDEYQADVIDDLGVRRASDLLAEMDPDDAADIIGDLPYEKAETLLRLMGVAEASTIRSLLGYKENTAGGIMTPEVTTVTDDMTIGQVIEHLRSEAAEKETIYYVYVVEDGRRLAGVISLRDLLLASPDAHVESLAERDLIVAHVDDDQEDVAEQMSKYDLLAMPIVDESGVLLGIVTVDDALDVLEQESAEDLALATGSSRQFYVATGILGWVGRRSQWVLLWAVLLVAAAIVARQYMPESGVLAVAAAFLLPLALRVSEEVSGHSLALLIESPSEDEMPSVGERLLIDGLGGLIVGLASGLLAFAVLEIVGADVAAALAIGAGLLVAGPVMTVVGTLMSDRARKRADDRPLPTGIVYTTVALAGALTYGFTIGVAQLTGTLG